MLFSPLDSQCSGVAAVRKFKKTNYCDFDSREINSVWQDGIIAFDTSVLLNVYAWTSRTRKHFFTILEKLKGQIWITSQVCDEYCTTISSIANQNIAEARKSFLTPFDDSTKPFKINKLEADHHDTFHGAGELIPKMQLLYEEAKAEIETRKESAKKMFDDWKDNYETEVAVTTDRIEVLFDGKIGPTYSRQEYYSYMKEATQRFTEKIPPGFEDQKKARNKYGDVISWYQLIDRAREVRSPVLLINDDHSKGDWFELGPDNSVKGPMRDLMDEMKREAGVEFYMESAGSFIKRASVFLGLPVDSEAVDDAEKVAAQAGQNDKENEQFLDVLDSSLNDLGRRLGSLRLARPNLDDKKLLNSLVKDGLLTKEEASVCLLHLTRLSDTDFENADLARVNRWVQSLNRLFEKALGTKA